MIQRSPKDISHNLIFIPFGLARASAVYKAPVRRDPTDPDYLMFERILRNDLIQLSVLYNRHLISTKESYSAVNVRPFHERRLLLDLQQQDYDGRNIIHFKRIIGESCKNNFT